MLDLSSNFLTEVPPLLSGLDLNELFLSKNRIRNLDLGVLKKGRLEILHVDGNEFQWLHASIVEFKKLKRLKLDW